MRLKLLPLLFLLLSTVCLSHGQAAALGHAITETAPPATQPPLIVTQFSASVGFIELYNQSSEPINLRNVQLGFTVFNQQITQFSEVNLPNSWLLPKQYTLLHTQQNNNPNVLLLEASQDIASKQVVDIEVVGSNYAYTIAGVDAVSSMAWLQHKQRGNATLKMSPVTLGDYTTKTGSPASIADPLYIPPSESGGLRVVEVLPNAKSCAPNDVSIICGDYIKLYNTSESVINLDNFRIRTDSGGVKASVSNTFRLYGELAPKDVVAINLKDNGDPLSLTNTGGYIWIEDAEGVILFEETLLQYPDATVAAGKGMSWALDMQEGAWKWMTPQPYGLNYWADAAQEVGQVVADLQECPAGKERNLETNRCRNIVSASTSSAPCKPGQERNAVTNRCRNIASNATAQKPCNADQYRSPETGRCRKAQTAASPAPCKPGQERNPLTGRCKKVVKKSSDIAAVEDLASAHKTDRKMLVYAGVGLMAAGGYGVYEWRQEIARKLSALRRRGKVR